MLILFDQKEYQKLNEKSYQLEKRRLQIELLKLQDDVIKNERRICIVFEGRDTAGKARHSSSLLNTSFLKILNTSIWVFLPNGNPVTGFKGGQKYFQKKVRSHF